MEIKLNRFTTVQVSAKTSLFQTQKGKKKTFVQIRNDKVTGAKIVTKTWFSKILFALFFSFALIGGYAHYMYDTVYLEYNPNPGLITGIILVITLIGFLLSIRKKTVLEIFLLGTTSGQSLNFPLDKTTDPNKLADLVDILVN